MKKPLTSRADPDSRKLYTRWHYQQNKATYKARARANNIRTRAKVRGFILEYLRGHPCIDCQEPDPIVLEFDHRLNVVKEFNIGDAVRLTISLRRVKAEVVKCDVRCANCHRRKTYRDRGTSSKG